MSRVSTLGAAGQEVSYHNPVYAGAPLRPPRQAPIRTAAPVARPASRRRSRWTLLALGGLAALTLSGCIPGSATPVPRISLGIEEAATPQDVSLSLQILFLLTVLALAPSILIMTTAFVRIIIVLALIRNALGIPQMPPQQVLVGLALFLTFFVMAPVWQRINADALQPLLAGNLTQAEALSRAETPVRQFMLRQVREKDLSLFVFLARLKPPQKAEDVPTYVLIPAFMIGEMKIAFQMGFIIFIPFLVIDMVVATVLMSMGMMMLPPVLISLPFKLLLFVMVDGWFLITRALVLSFN